MNRKGINKKIFIGWLMLFFITQISVFGQTTYVIKPKIDFSLIGIGAVSHTLGQVLGNNSIPLTTQEINGLNPSQINSFDRNAVFNYSQNAEMASDILLYSSIAVPLSLLLDKKARNEWITIGVMGMEVLMVTSGITNTIKPVALRSRPLAYNPEVPEGVKMEVDTRFSFFSGHTAVSASMTFFAAKVFSDLNPDSKWKPVVWVGAITIPAATAWARVEAGKHFPTDVIAGYAIGAAIGYFIPVMHLQKDATKAQLKLMPTFNGMAMQLVF